MDGVLPKLPTIETGDLLNTISVLVRSGFMKLDLSTVF
jgi:hypothetical protein